MAGLPLTCQSAIRTCPWAYVSLGPPIAAESEQASVKASQAGHRGLACLGQEKAQNDMAFEASHGCNKLPAYLGQAKAQNGHVHGRASHKGHQGPACLCHAKALYGHVPGRTSYLGHQLLACLGHPKAQNGLDPGEHSTSAPRAGPPWQCQRGLACLSQEKAQTGHVPGRASHKSHYGLASLGMEKAQNGHALGARRTRATKGWPILARLSWPPILARLMRTTDNPLGGRGMRASKVGLPWPGQSAKRT